MDSIYELIASDPDSMTHNNNPFCLVLKICIIQLMTLNDVPVLFRTPEFLSSMAVFYLDLFDKFLVTFNFSTSQRIPQNDLFVYATFIANMKHWKRNNQYLFYNLEFTGPRLTFTLDHEGFLNLLLLVHELNGNFFSNLQDHGFHC